MLRYEAEDKMRIRGRKSSSPLSSCLPNTLPLTNSLNFSVRLLSACTTNSSVQSRTFFSPAFSLYNKHLLFKAELSFRPLLAAPATFSLCHGIAIRDRALVASPINTTNYLATDPSATSFSIEAQALTRSNAVCGQGSWPIQHTRLYRTFGGRVRRTRRSSAMAVSSESQKAFPTCCGDFDFLTNGENCGLTGYASTKMI
jgi:hypothetical protein